MKLLPTGGVVVAVATTSVQKISVSEHLPMCCTLISLCPKKTYPNIFLLLMCPIFLCPCYPLARSMNFGGNTYRQATDYQNIVIKNTIEIMLS